MRSSRTLSQESAQSSHGRTRSLSAPGKPPRQLRQGKFATFTCMPMFESNFIQMSKREVIDVRPFSQFLTSCCWHDPCQWCSGTRRDRHTQGTGLQSGKSSELTRLLPFKFIQLSIYRRKSST